MAVNSNHNNMKGLQLFIANLRSSQQAKEQERRIQSEIINIQKQFSSSHGVNGYQRKKYVAKLAYIYITTNTTKLNQILFGLEECCQLLKSTSYSEKFIGYMSLELFFQHETVRSKFSEHALPQVKLDLASKDDDIVCLALNFIGVLGKHNDQFTEALINDVFQVLRSPTSASILKKKSSLTFLTLLKNNPAILTQDDNKKVIWIQRIIGLLDDDTNYRLMLSVLPLVEYIACYVDFQSCVKLIPQLTQILYNCVVIGTKHPESFPEEYKFSQIPNPWLITKLVSLLNVLIMTNGQQQCLVSSSNIDQATLGKLRMVVTRAIELGTRPAHDVLMRTVQNTVLFSLVNFASKLDPSPEAISNSVNALCSLLDSNETNTRYLTLDSLVKLCSVSGKPALNAVKSKHLAKLFTLLKQERDSSISRKVLDLLYTLTDGENVEFIVGELLSFMDSRLADHHIKEDIAVKLAILTEKFARDSNWFVIVSLKLLSLTNNTSFNDDDIWQRLVQIVVNNSDLHKLTCDHLIEYLYDNNASESIVKSGAFLWGEYGNLITDKLSIGDMFNIFAEKYFAVSNLAKAMILTTMIKLYKVDPIIGSAVIKFYQLELNSLDIELQTRSYEYLKIIQYTKMNGGDTKLLDLLFSSLPPFNSKRNPLLGRLGNLSSNSTPTIASISSLSDGPSPPETASTGASVPPPTPPQSRKLRSYYAQQQLTPNWQEGFHRMLLHKKGIFYTNSLIKILYRITPSASQPSLMTVSLTFVNRSEWPISGLLVEVVPFRTDENPAYVVHNVELPSTTVKSSTGSDNGNNRTSHSFEILLRRPFDVEESPILSLQFKCGGSVNTLRLKIPMGITSTILGGGNTLTLQQFIQRWRAIGDALGQDGESHRVCSTKLQDTYALVYHTLPKLGFDIVEQSMASNTVFAAGIIHTKSEGNFGCLMKLKCLAGSVEITCKVTTGDALASYVVDCVNRVLEGI